MSSTTDSSDVEAFRASARSLLAGTTSPARLRTLRDRQPPFERTTWRTLAEAGWLSVLVPESLGGLELTLPCAAAVVEEAGRALLPEPLVAGMQAVAVLCAVPAGAVRDDLLTRALSGELVAGVAWQESAGELEPGAGTGRTRAAGRGGDSEPVTLNGSKGWVVPGVGADGWLVMAEAIAGPAVYWMPAQSQGVTCHSVSRVDGSSMARLTFSEASVPGSHELAVGDVARQAVAHGNDIARLLQAAELLGVARQAYELTLEHLKTRHQFGKPIGANQALQHRMVDALLQIELCAAALGDAVRVPLDDARSLAMAASRAKARCAHAALEIGRLAVQLHGAMGYTDECDIGLHLKRAWQGSGWLGTAAAHRLRHLRLVRQESPVSTATATAPATATATATADADAETSTVDDFPSDADWAAMSDEAFRAMVRAFFRQHYPKHLRHLSRRVQWHEIKDWYLTLSRQGWLAPSWPKEHGGMALPPDKLLAFIEEQEDHGVARMPDQGLINLGPLLIGHGTPEQRAHWLPKIISGEHVWCQGYSEPNAGSDLASLRTEAVADGDDFVVNGQKIWTTLAHNATHIYLLVRTDKSGRKQEGISFLLADLSSPGITVRPIRNIAGEEEFCEVFFDNVRVPRANIVGRLNEGWHIAKTLLGFERIFVGSPKTPQYALGQLRALADARGLFDDAAFAASYAALQLDLADLRSLYSGFADMVKRGEALPPSVSLLKIWATETYTRIGAKLVEVAEEDGATMGEHAIGNASLDPAAPLMNALVTTIYGGTNEIQRNILSRQVLGLPN